MCPSSKTWYNFNLLDLGLADSNKTNFLEFTANVSPIMLIYS